MKRYILTLWAALACALPRVAAAHPGTGIVVDRKGNVYFVDMVSGVWRVDSAGVLTHVNGPAFHWLALDENDRLARVTLPSGTSGDIVRLGNAPTLLLASDVPVATRRDGALYYPSRSGNRPIDIIRLMPNGQASTFATLPAGPVSHPLRWVNGLAAAGDGSVYYAEDAAVRRIDARGRLSTLAERIAPTNCRSVPGISAADGPLLRGLVVDSGGVVYVAATGCASVLRIHPSGNIQTIYRSEGEWSPTGVAQLGSRIYVLEFLGAGSDDRQAMLPRVRVIEPTGTRVIATVHRGK